MELSHSGSLSFFSLSTFGPHHTFSPHTHNLTHQNHALKWLALESVIIFSLSTIPNGFLSLHSVFNHLLHLFLLFHHTMQRVQSAAIKTKGTWLFYLWEPKGPSSAAIFSLCFHILLNTKVYNTPTHTQTSNLKCMMAFLMYWKFFSHSYPLGLSFLLCSFFSKYFSS